MIQCTAGLLPFSLAAYCVPGPGGIVEDQVSFTVVDDHRHMRAVDGRPPIVRHSTVWTYRVRSSKLGRLDVVSRNSYEEFSNQVPFPVEREAANCSKIPHPDDRSRCVQTVVSVQRGVCAICPVLCLNPDSQVEHNESQ